MIAKVDTNIRMRVLWVSFLIGMIIGIILICIPVAIYGLDEGMQIVANYILPIWFLFYIIIMISSESDLAVSIMFYKIGCVIIIHV